MSFAIFVWTPFPHAYLALYLALILAALVTPPSPHRRLFFVPILVLTWRLIHDAQAGYFTSTLWFGYLLVASDYILLTDVQRELHQVPDTADSRSTRVTIRNIEYAPLKARIKWALQLFISPRGVGWEHEPRSAIPSGAPPNTPRIKFIIRQSACLVVAFLCFDIMNLHLRWNPAFYARMGMVSAGWTWRFVGTAGFGMGAAAALSTVHYTLSIIFVALGVSVPQDWPPLFGDLASATSVRAFWSRSWHQLFRRSLCAHAKIISGTILGMPDRSTISLCVQGCCAFMLSGLVHYLGETVPMKLGRSGSLIFFGIQPIGIALETLAGTLAQRAGVQLPRTASQALGWMWVFAWFSSTLPIMQDPLIKTGQMDSRVDVSLIMGLSRGMWVLPSGRINLFGV
ncbi:membrane bound O-acyl transferase family-domain-containing protein [Mycena alexandri]|uniref:Membrane bound O-acyl transferase family-domain-containing protein n=1 Tax=Mycena alexandri TaxID=1745969 RepID=A0AAD6SWJ4_9AGAR|nr:membrane bound O-acyl transferase family-domain-containing protein [Mycena alexandri]